LVQNTIQAHRIETVLDDDGQLILENLPFKAGQAVEVIVLPQSIAAPINNSYPLRGTPATYDQPFDPVA
jgi:hypothetical protein